MAKEGKEAKEVFKRNLVSMEELQKVIDRLDDLIHDQSKNQSSIQALSMARSEFKNKLDDMRQEILNNGIDMSNLKHEVRSLKLSNQMLFITSFLALFLAFMLSIYSMVF